MLNNQLGFVAKIILLSSILSFLIKYGGRLLPIPESNFIALISICLPTLIMALLLSWQFFRKGESL